MTIEHREKLKSIASEMRMMRVSGMPAVTALDKWADTLTAIATGVEDIGGCSLWNIQLGQRAMTRGGVEVECDMFEASGQRHFKSPNMVGFSVWARHGYFYPEGPRGVETDFDIVKMLPTA